MRIFVIAARYLPNKGGLETVVREISGYMQQAGHEVEIVTNRYPRRLPPSETIDGTLVTRLDFIIPQWEYLKNRRIDLWLAGIVFFPLTLFRLSRILRRFQPDIVNIHYLGIHALFVWLLQRSSKTPLIVSLHGGDVDSEPYQSKFKHWLFSTVLRRANRITSCSQTLLDEALSLLPEIKSKAVVIHNGVNADLFLNAAPYDYPRSYLLGVGQLVKHKGFDLLISAFDLIAAEYPDVDLLIAGGGPEYDTLCKQIEATNLGERIRMLGSVDREQVAALMRGSLATAIPSRREPFGIVGLEAMASGRPIIASTIDGLKEALQGGEVTWFTSDNVQGLAQCLRTVLAQNNPSLIESNRELARGYSWQSVTEEYLKVYRSI
jgi:glycosyltransferase involved in cell wall biosynthesis